MAHDRHAVTPHDDARDSVKGLGVIEEQGHDLVVASNRHREGFHKTGSVARRV